jgi:hypothetical protein
MSLHRFYGGTGASIASVGTSGAAITPAFGLVPGTYAWAGQAYPCYDPGLYHFFNPATQQHHIRPLWLGSVDQFIRAMAWMFSHGTQDNALTPAQMLDVAKQRVVQAQCGHIAACMKYLIPQCGVPATDVRVINLTSLDPASLPGDTGHVIFEERSSGSWHAWDFSGGGYFADAGGNHLSVAQVIAAGAANCTWVSLRDLPAYAPGSPVASYCDLFWRLPEQRQAWRERIYQSWSVAP